MVAVPRPPGIFAFPRTKRMKRGQADAGGGHLVKDDVVRIETGQVVIDDVDVYAFARLFGEETGKGAAGVVRSEDVHLETDPLPGIADCIEGGMEGFAVF